MDLRFALNRCIEALAPGFVVVMFFAHEITLGLALLMITIGWYSGHPINVLCGLILTIGPFVNLVVERVRAYRRKPD